MQLKKVADKTYYIEHSTNIGVYQTGAHSVCLIDTGNYGDGEKIEEIITAQGWQIDYIVNTHTHIDHLGGNPYLIQKYDIPAYCSDADMPFAHYSELEAAYMNGGYPCEELHKIFRHPGKIGFHTLEEELPKELEWTELPGHSFGMVGIKTPDDVWFLGDAYLNRKFLQKYRLGFLYHVKAFLETLDKLETLAGRLFIPAHGIPEEDITEILELNRRNNLEIAGEIMEICRKKPMALDQILQQMYSRFLMRRNVAQHALLSSTTKSYLTYLQDKGALKCEFIDDVMTWKAV